MPFGGGFGKRPSGGPTYRLASRTSVGSVRRPFRRATSSRLGGRGTAGAGFAGAHQQPVGPRVASQQVLGMGQLPRHAATRGYDRNLLFGIADMLKKLNAARQQLGQPDLVWRDMGPQQREGLIRRIKWDMSEQEGQ